MIKSFRPYDPRIRLDAVSYKKIRDIQKWTGEKQNTETVRAAIDARWQVLKEEQDDLKVRLVEAENNVKKEKFTRKDLKW